MKRVIKTKPLPFEPVAVPWAEDHQCRVIGAGSLGIDSTLRKSEKVQQPFEVINKRALEVTS